MEQVHSCSLVPINSKSPHPGLGFLTTFRECKAACCAYGWGQRMAYPVCFPVGREIAVFASLGQGPAAGHGHGNPVPQALAHSAQHCVCAGPLGWILSSDLHISLVTEETGPQSG